MTNLNQMTTNTCNTRHMAHILSYFIKNLGPEGKSPTRSQDYNFVQHRKHHHLVLSYFIKACRHQEPMTNLNQMSTNTCNTRHMAHILSYFIKKAGTKGESPTRSQDYHFMQHRKHHHLVLSYFIKKLRRQELDRKTTTSCNTKHHRVVFRIFHQNMQAPRANEQS